MPRDYKNNFRQPPKKKWRPEIMPIAALILVVLGGIFWAYHHKATALSSDGFSVWLAEIKTKWSHRKPNVLQAQSLTLAQKEAQNNEVHFDFYNELPKMQVGVPETAKKTAALTSTPASAVKPADLPIKSNSSNSSTASQQYLVTIATFNEPAGASQLRISLLLAGVEAVIVKTQAGDKTIYSIQQGPYASAALAKTSLRKLQQKGFNGTLLKIAN